MLIIIACAAFAATLLGGLFAIRFKDRLHLILGFSAGAVIGVAFFDLMPEAFDLLTRTHSAFFVMSVVAGGFLGYLILDRFLFFHSHHNEEHDHETVSRRGFLGAGSLAVHSFFDGVAIGIAFQVSPALGIVVSVAVLVHDFSDGINTVGLIIKNKGHDTTALKWLIVDAVAPVLGIVSTLFFSLSESSLGIVLALFSGFFLYIGASDLLPESHHNHPTVWTTVATVLGVVVLFVAIKIAGI